MTPRIELIDRLLSLQRADGTWSGVAWNRGFTSTMHALTLLRDLGADPADAPVAAAVARVRDQVTWAGCRPDECASNRFFEGEVEPCINGQVAAVGAYFTQDVRPLVNRLLSEQLADGGWNCDAERGSTRSSFHTTICVLEALLEHERAAGFDAAVTAARHRAHEYLLERGLFRRRSTGEPIADRKRPGADWTRFAFPCWWHYDVLRALDYFRAAGIADPRMAEAVDLVRSRRLPSGQWQLDVRYPGPMLVEIDDGVGQPNPWITERAARVLDAWDNRA